MSHPQSYEILLVPRFAEETTTGAAESDAAESGAAESEAPESEAVGSEATAPEAARSEADAEATEPGGVVRSAVVSATGETGASGYPRYSGEGVVADIDPETHAVEALLVDGSELSYGLSARVKETDAGTGADR
ncbi:hypothetical protein [Streptomyces sp. NPDC002215]|uniref:hypothetical protein n=1 Tax=Streptomyces sp. NPDC002215 TaxID=3154412 RepID=UPI003328A00D